jgi:2-methylisocitrate lyase-like PEP mutase family enzyme
MTPGQTDKVARFLELHRPGRPLLMPNAWDRGAARVLDSLGFEALATTSSGYAATLGRLDYSVSRPEALTHAAELVEATEKPVSADLENGFADDPEEVAETVRLAVGTGLAGCSIEDFTGYADDPIYGLELAAERVAAAAKAAHSGPGRLVLTARAENFLHGRPDLDDTIARLRAFEQAGADVLYAPGISDANHIRQIVDSLAQPVNVIARPGAPPVARLADLGVSRVSVGGAFAFAALGALENAGREFREEGTYGYTELAAAGLRAARKAFRA